MTIRCKKNKEIKKRKRKIVCGVLDRPKLLNFLKNKNLNLQLTWSPQKIIKKKEIIVGGGQMSGSFFKKIKI